MTANKVLILVESYDTLCEAGIKLLKDHGLNVELNLCGRGCKQKKPTGDMAEVAGVIAGLESWDKAAMDAYPNLKVIARFGIGYETVDLEEAKRQGIVVTNCPAKNAAAVAEHAVALLFAAARQIPCLDERTKNGSWERVMFRELAGKTVGLLGLGNVGQCFAKMMQGFDCSLLAYNRTPKPEAAKELGITQVDLEEVLRRSDYVSLHLAADDQTKHIINEKTLRLMKKDAVIVNVARGALVQEAALVDALRAGRIGAYATDVFENEPAEKDDPLLKTRGVICTPHVAGVTYESYPLIGLTAAQAIVDVLSKKEPANRIA
ncbi:MAG: phosphoglycerate dehydrogenase [Christensenellaceae bacterium]|nr:phosphoglycerate dehydrogenase [Christensenellaceae bacterium]